MKMHCSCNVFYRHATLIYHNLEVTVYLPAILPLYDR